MISDENTGHSKIRVIFRLCVLDKGYGSCPRFQNVIRPYAKTCPSIDGHASCKTLHFYFLIVTVFVALHAE